MTTLEQVAEQVVQLRNEMNAMQTSVILTQGLIRSAATESRRGEEEGADRERDKIISHKIKESQHLIPTPWSGEKDGPFADLAHDVVTYMNCIFEDEANDILLEVIKHDKTTSVDDIDEEHYPNKKLLNSHLYAILSKITKGEAKSIIRNAQRNGIEAWHRLHATYDPRTTTDSSVSIQRIINPVKGKDAGTTKAALEKFETDVREHEAKFETVPESLKVAGLKNLIPEAWFEQHFKGAKFDNYGEAKAKVLSIANDRRMPRMKTSPTSDATVSYWGNDNAYPDEESLNYYGKAKGGYAGASPYGKAGWSSYGKGFGKSEFGGKAKGNPYDKGGYPKGDKGKGKGKGWDKGGGKDGGKGFRSHADKDCYVCYQRGHIAANCPNKGGGKGGMSSFEEGEYEPEETIEDTPNVSEEVEWLGYLANVGNEWEPVPERDDKWLGCLNVVCGCAGELGSVENNWETPKKAATPKKQVKDNKPDIKTENQFDGLREKENAIRIEMDKLKKKEQEIQSEINSFTAHWEAITVTVDSGAANNVAPKNAFPWVKLEENDDSRNGRYYTTANGKRVYVLGEKTVTIRSKEGVIKKIKFQICDVTRILASVSKIAKADNTVTMKKNGGVIKDLKGNEMEIEIENGVYVIKASIKIENEQDMNCEMCESDNQTFRWRGA